MTSSVPEALLRHLSEFLAERIGLHFPKERWRDLERAVCAAARELGCPGKEPGSCIEWLTSAELTKAQTEILASHLTVGETYFFREKTSFEALENHVIPELVRSRRGKDQRLRIWSAGCATGEEPYSIAILLSRMIPDLSDWNITILATDINPRFLEKASRGIYGAWSFREAPPWLQAGYFSITKDGRFELLSHVRAMVAFSYLNLAQDSYPSLFNNTNAMDIILCRNVLMYFRSKGAKKAISNFYCSLADGGWLIVSPVETWQPRDSEFAPANLFGLTLYRKDTRTPETAFAPGCKPPEEPTVAGFPVSESLGDAGAGARPHHDLGRNFPVRIEGADTAEAGPAPDSDALSLYEREHSAETAGRILPPFPQSQREGKAMALLARVCANEGKLAEALKWCEKALTADKLNAALHFLRAAILQELGATNETAAALKRCLYLDPDFVLAHFSLGHLALRQAKYRESTKHFENALSLLRVYPQEEVLPESDGVTAGRLAEIIQATTSGGPLA